MTSKYFVIDKVNLVHVVFSGPFDTYDEAKKSKTNDKQIIVATTYQRNVYGAPIYPFQTGED